AGNGSRCSATDISRDDLIIAATTPHTTTTQKNSGACLGAEVERQCFHEKSKGTSHEKIVITTNNR
ncbi:hypothetical protein, partial [Salmonella sp. s58408]|uniref:hypothetical protein n=1 Tax=Salmonella sp. s58408 TaxID=3159701 RepID=UPI0039818A92